MHFILLFHLVAAWQEMPKMEFTEQKVCPVLEDEFLSDNCDILLLDNFYCLFIPLKEIKIYGVFIEIDPGPKRKLIFEKSSQISSGSLALVCFFISILLLKFHNFLCPFRWELLLGLRMSLI